MSAVDVVTGISLETGCECGPDDAAPLLHQMSQGPYREMSVLPLPGSVDEWRANHRTARRRADGAYARGYLADTLERERWEQDVYRINVSATHRQGRPMSAGYRETQTFSPLPDYPCARHAIRTTGVWGAGHLVGYLVMIRAGQLALVSQILGHNDHLKAEIMYLLFEHALEREIKSDPAGYVVYNRHDSGTDGLRFFKERLGFREQAVEWLP